VVAVVSAAGSPTVAEGIARLANLKESRVERVEAIPEALPGEAARPGHFLGYDKRG